MSAVPATSGDQAVQTVPVWMTFLLATACGLIAANVDYAQPLVGPIAEELHLAGSGAGLIVTMTQIGYGLGLLFIVPLADLAENRRLVLCILAVAALSLLAAGFALTAAQFLAAALVVGLCSVAVQILVTYAAHLATDATRGRIIGNVTGGLMLGIMLARPVASLVTAVSSWRALFFCAAVVIMAVALALALSLPARRPQTRLSYFALLGSLGHLARHTAILQRRSVYHAFLFAAFSLFWTTVPLVLAGRFQLSQAAIALFALAGAAGAVAAPLAGRLADRGLGKPATAGAMLLVAGAFLLTQVDSAGSPLALAAFTLAAIMLDFGVQMNGVVGQRAILASAPEVRGRLNGLYIASFFMAGAIGSALAGWAYAKGGWALTSWVGFALPVAALICLATERSEFVGGGNGQ